MGASMQAQKTSNVGGLALTQNKTLTGNGAIGIPAAPTVAKAGTLTVRGSISAGSITFSDSSHGIITGQRLDLYWSGGRRRGVVVGTVAGAVVPFTAGAGTDLPVLTTVMQASTPVKVACGFSGDDINYVGISIPAGVDGQVAFVDGSLAELYYKRIYNGTVWEWFDDLEDVNPFAGAAIRFVYVSHNDIAIAQTVQVGILHD